MQTTEQTSPSPDATNRQRIWLASILLRSQQTWFARFALQLRRLASMGRGQRRRLERKAALSLAGAALVLSLGANLMRPMPVYAASITVDDGVVAAADDGQCSIIEAIINANNDSAIYATAGECVAGSGADTINLPTNGLFVLDTAYSYAYYSDTGLPNITSEITIEGNGSEILRNVLAPAMRIMSVTATGDLTLNETTISGGYSTEDGGGLYVVGSALIQGSAITGNYAADDGGGIEVDEGGSLIIDSSSIGQNAAGALGGGVSAETGATLTIRNNSVISNNYAVDGGGGVATDESGLVTIDNSIISDNDSGYFGGGISTYDTEIVIQNNTTISLNETEVYGGGADFYLSEVTITDSTISGNFSYLQGGGLHLDGSVVTIERSTIDNNHTANYTYGFFGGGIYNGSLPEEEECDQECDYVPGILNITESTISGNSSWGGGGIYSGYFTQTTINKTTIRDNTASYGGGFASISGAWTIANSTLSGNRAEVIDEHGGYGGAIFNVSFAPVELFPASLVLSTVTGNYAEVEGGGIYIYSGPLLIAGSVVSGNTAIGLGNEIYNYDSNSFGVYTGYSVLGHSGETTAEALHNITPDSTDIAATSDGTLPTVLTAILDTTLADNGGPTFTHALVANSPAVDYVPDTVCDPASPIGDLTDDQRSEPRNIDIPGMGNDGGPNVCDVGAYELQLPDTGAFCPVDDELVAYLRTDAIGTGQGSPTKGFRTRKLVVPNSNDVATLYGQLAATEVGVMKYVRFLPQGSPKVQLHAPTSLAYNAFAISWWGSDLPADANYVKGQFFWGAKANKSPRAFVLWPTYETDVPYANVFATFDESTENHVAWEAGFIPMQTQTLEIPPTQEDGATINVTVAVVDVNKDGRSVILTVEAGGVSEERVLTLPSNKDSLNLEEFALVGVDTGTDEVVITLESPFPGVDFPDGGDSAAMIGAAANYLCEIPDGLRQTPDASTTSQPNTRQSTSFWTSLADRFSRVQTPTAATAERAGGEGGFWSQAGERPENGRQHWADRSADDK